jgi:hypothetical protein
VQRDLELDLLGLQAADSEGMVFVYEFDRDDGARRGFGNGFADAVEVAMVSVKWSQCAYRQEKDVRGVGAGADGLGYNAKGKVAG